MPDKKQPKGEKIYFWLIDKGDTTVHHYWGRRSVRNLWWLVTLHLKSGKNQQEVESGNKASSPTYNEQLLLVRIHLLKVLQTSQIVPKLGTK